MELEMRIKCGVVDHEDVRTWLELTGSMWNHEFFPTSTARRLVIKEIDSHAEALGVTL